MFIYELINFIVGILCIIAIIYIIYRLYAWRQGNEHLVIMAKRRTPFIVEDINFNEVILSCEVPFANRGKQYATIMDMFPRHLMPQEQFDGVHIESWLTDKHHERHDGYWEALIVKQRKSGTIKLRVVFTSKTGNIRTDLQGFPNMPIDIYHQVVGRTDYRISKTRVVLTARELQDALRQ